MAEQKSGASGVGDAAGEMALDVEMSSKGLRVLRFSAPDSRQFHNTVRFVAVLAVIVVLGRAWLATKEPAERHESTQCGCCTADGV
ncbi:hypothetical protein ACIQOV_32150 [Kitasatospora sp. NPDC091257]|uniref:hypothetical protein n=1 Tax=Kitasatospora sp. NPDC091257 TaxID=3364084 RepID=UPI00380D2C97